MMNRKSFVKKSLLGGLLLGLTGRIQAAFSRHEEELKPLPPVGFEHLPTLNSMVMNNMVIHRANTRGHANHGWLNSNHTFSFASYYNRERMHFGVLRVLNDDIIAGGAGFGTHPHDNMEIISVPIKGALEHKDSMGNIAAIHEGEIQVMSAGTGIYHSEYNKYKDKSAEFLQIWVFPKAHNVKPRYDQQKFELAGRKNQWQNIVAPMETKDTGVKIHQDAWFHLGDLQAGKKLQYDLHLKTNGLYVFVIDGKVKVAGQDLERRDGLGIWDIAKVDFEASSDAQLLLMEVPMNLPRY